MGQLSERQRPLRGDEYERMVAAGFFRDERVELIQGVVVEMSPQSAPHSYVIQILSRLLMPRLVGRADVRVQLPFVAGADSVPEPDLAVVALGNYMNSHPSQALLIIEVADSSLKFDRLEKAELYARVSVPEYWIVNLADRFIERHSEPTSGAYARVTPFRKGEAVAPISFADIELRVDEVFGE
jgi:Uma2 family endonuclease